MFNVLFMVSRHPPTQTAAPTHSATQRKIIREVILSFAKVHTNAKSQPGKAPA